MDTYPQNLVEQYLKASSKLKKFDRIVFKRFAQNVNVTEVLDEFSRLAVKFEEAGIDQYAAMAFLGVAKCEMSAGNIGSEVQAYLKAARAFLRAHNTLENLQTKSNRSEYKEGALRCYTLAVERCPDEAVFKASIIREMTPLQPHFDGTSTFASPAHCINELELSANAALERLDFLAALKNLDDIVDNIEERKSQALYEELLCRVEILRLFLLIVLDLPPSSQSPSHIKLIEFYYHLGNFEEVDDIANTSGDPGVFVPLELKYAIAEIIVPWVERRFCDLKLALDTVVTEFMSLNAAHHFVISHIASAVENRI